MGSYYCHNCKDWHTDIQSNVCPKLRQERWKKGECPECGKKTDNGLQECSYCEAQFKGVYKP